MLLCAFIFRCSACQTLKLAIHAPARERGGQRVRTRKKISGEKEEKTTGQISKQANTKAFLCVIKGGTYLILAGEEHEERRKKGNSKAERTRNKRQKATRGIEGANERKAERGINERGGERSQGKATLTHMHTERERLG